MKIVKKFVIILITFLILILSILPSFSYAESLNDAQRQALVDVLVKMIDEGNKARILRYSQDHRMVGYDWRKLEKNEQQLTRGNVNLTEADLVRVKNILMREQGVKKESDLYKMPTTLGYQCYMLGDYIQDTIPFDCSSLVGAAYNMTVGTNYGGWAWSSHKYKEDSEWFEVSTDFSSIKPGDVLWKEGHVAIYLGDCYNDGTNYIAEAAGFARINKSSEVMRQRLLDFLDQNPEYIVESENFNGKMPTLQLPADGVMDVTKQVIITEYKPGRFTKYAVYVGPISEGRAIDVTNLKTTNQGNSGLDHDPITLPGNYSVVWPKDLVLEDQTLATSEGYFYKGTPTYGQYIGRVDLFNWLINGVEDVLDWLIGFITYGFKAVLIGWTAIMEDVMSSILNFGITEMPESNSSNTENNEAESNSESETQNKDGVAVLKKISSENLEAYNIKEATEKGTLDSVATLAAGTTTSTSIDITSELDATETKKKLTIEDVLFNRVPVLDINFFDFENAGGQKISQDSLLYKIRSTIASWYYVIRMVVIIGMLLVLLYLAIKMAISMPGKKAEYKSKLIDWIVGFIIVFFIHYFMVIVVGFNNQIVKILDPVITSSTTVDTPDIETNSDTNVVTQNDGQTSLYEAIRIQSYDVRATTGLTAAVMYMVLVFFMIRFVILYAKRLFVLVALTIISPIMGLLYSINKKKYKIGDWGKEYIYNVLIQFVHVVIYTAIVSLAFELSKTSTFRGGIIALMALSFLLVAEEQVKKIFGFNKASSSGSLMGSAIGQLAAVGVVKSIYNKTEEKAAKIATKYDPNNNFFVKMHNKSLQKNMSVSEWADKYKPSDNVTETEEEARKRRAARVLDSKAYKSNTKKHGLAGVEYIVDKNGVPMSPYYDFEMDPDKKKYFNMSSINNRIDDLLKEERDARRAYATQGLKDIWYSTTGMFSVMAAIPMIVISPKTGLGFGVYGIHALSTSMGRRKIEGAKRITEPKKWTGKRLVFAWATGGFSEGIANMAENSKDTNYVLRTDYGKKLELLNNARECENRVAQEIAKLELERRKNDTSNSEKSTEKIKEAEKKIESVARDLDKQEFNKALGKTLETISKKDIEKVIENYILKKKTDKLTDKDIENITNALGRKVEEKCNNVTLSNDFSSVLREEIRDRVVIAGGYIVIDKEGKKQASVNTQVTQTGADIRDKYIRNNSSSENNKITGNNKENKQADSNNENKVHLKDIDFKEFEGIEITEEELDKKVDDVMKDMRSEELIETIDSALKREGALDREIKNPRYSRLMGMVSELDKINSEYKELTGEQIYRLYEVKDKKIQPKRDSEGEIEYQSVKDLVNSMRNYIVDYINNEYN